MTSDRAEIRAAQRDRRAAERAQASQARTEQRAIEREAQARQRAAAREERHGPSSLDGSAIGLARAERSARSDREPVVKRRKSGALARTGEVQKVRDTRNYHTVVDTDRMRILAKRGASTAGLAAAFGVSIAVVEAALVDTTFAETSAETGCDDANVGESPITEDGLDLPW